VKRFSLLLHCAVKLFFCFFWFAVQVIRASDYLQPSSFVSLFFASDDDDEIDEVDRTLQVRLRFRAAQATILRRQFAAQAIRASDYSTTAVCCASNSRRSSFKRRGLCCSLFRVWIDKWHLRSTSHDGKQRSTRTINDRFPSNRR
jgi:hypothetical protein